MVLFVGCWLGLSVGRNGPSADPVKTSGVTDAAPIYPLDVVVDEGGSAWVVDLNLPGVWKYQSGEVTKAIEGSKKFRQKLNKVRCLAISPSGQLYLGDTATREVYKVGADGSLEPTVQSVIGIPMDIAFAKDGTMYVADLERRVLYKVSPGGSPEVFAEINPRGVFVDSKDQIWVVSQTRLSWFDLLRRQDDGDRRIAQVQLSTPSGCR